MPFKSRIQEQSFQTALRSLRVDELSLLHNTRTTSAIWGRVCILMQTADNTENRRACYDAWKRKRFRSHDIVNEILSADTLKPKSPEFAFLPEESSPVNGITNPNVTTNDNHHSPIKRELSLNTVAEDNGAFIANLHDFLTARGIHVPLIYKHDSKSEICSGSAVAFEVICKCSNLPIEEDGLTEKSASDFDKSNEDYGQFSKDQISLDDQLNLNQPEKESDVSSDDDSLCGPKLIIADQSNLSTTDSAHRFDDETSSIYSGFQLKLSPSSSASVVTSPMPDEHNPRSDENRKTSILSQLVSKAKNILSTSKPPDHSIIDEEQRDVLNFLQRKSADTPKFFTRDIDEIQRTERAKAIIISQFHMDVLKQLKEKEINKKETNKSKSNKDLDDEVDGEGLQRNLQWTILLDFYVSQSNDYCVFMYERHHFTSRTNIGNTNKFFMSADAHCKFIDCPCRLHAVIHENGKLKIDYRGNIMHSLNEIRSRPIRGTRREELQKLTMFGASPGSLHLQQLKSMSTANKEAGNRNNVGSSSSVLRKIASEGNVKLRRDADLDKSLQELKTELAKKIFPAEQVSGYLQEISTDPLRLICFTAGGIATYHRFASTMPLSWDATGGIVINRGKRIFYYELTMSNLIKGGPSFPIAIMLSASHGTMDIVHWMNCFIEKYKQVYGFSKPFPKPPIIHSDRAVVFLMAGIQVFNNDETMDRYLERCWRIVKQTATKRDLEITIVHACLGHFMKNVKINATKDLQKKQVPFGMWLVALLVNSNTLDEMSLVWRNICFVLLSPTQNDYYKISLATLSKLANEMNQNPDKTNFVLKNVSITSKGECKSTLNDTKDECAEDETMVGEEDAVLSTDSSFRELFIKIYQESKELVSIYDSPSWKALPTNPLFSAVYLRRLLKLYMPVAPIWSNLLLGDFYQRYGYSSTSNIPPCPCHYGRTTGISELQMHVMKHAILNKKIYSRVDEVVSKLGDLIETVEIQFVDYISVRTNKMRILPLKKQKPAQEQWNKRQRRNRKTGVYTTEKPPVSLATLVNNHLMGHDDDANLGEGQLEHFLRFENKHFNCWFNAMMQMLLASGHLVQVVRNFGSIDVELVPRPVFTISCILTSLVNWNRDKRTAIEQNIVKDQFFMTSLGYLLWAELPVSFGKQNCVLDFFTSAILPTLRFYDIDFQFSINISIECTACKKISSIDQQPWDYLLVPQTATEDTFINAIADLFGRAPSQNVCPKCSQDDLHSSGLSFMKCPKHIFVRFDPTVTRGVRRQRLTTHLDLAPLMSDLVVFTRSYARFTLQSFIIFTGVDNHGHYVTFAQKKGEWFRLDDMNIDVVSATSLFGEQEESQPAILAHFIRPSVADVFSVALWNVFTNFSQPNIPLQPTLSLNEAVNYFGSQNILRNNPLNLVVVKRFECVSCKKDTYSIESLHEIWEMRTDANHINTELRNFFYKHIKCSSCQKSGFSNAILYDIPQFLVLRTRSNDTTCISIIDDTDLLVIQPSLSDLKFEYSIQTAIFVIQDDDVFYLRKTSDGYNIYNKISNQFQPLIDVTIEHTGLASEWTVLIYETGATVFDYPRPSKATTDRSHLEAASEPEECSIGTVRGLLPKFRGEFDVGPIRITSETIESLVDMNGDLNDLLIDAYLFIISSTSPKSNKVLAVPSYIMSQIIDKQVRKFDASWLEYNQILCPINQDHHWYLLILDFNEKLVIELDSMPTHKIPRQQNITRVLQFLNMQNKLVNHIDLDFTNEWRIATPLTGSGLEQHDSHSCGVHILVQSESYVKQRQFANITKDNIRQYRYHLAEAILRKAEPIPESIAEIDDGLIEPSPKTLQRMRKQHRHKRT